MSFTWKDVIGLIGNIGNLVYNIPQIVLTFRRKSTRDISSTFLLLRFLIAILWLVYGIDPIDYWWIVLNSVTALATAFVGYYKIRELWRNHYHPYTFSSDGPTLPVVSKNLPKTMSMAALSPSVDTAT